MLLKILIGLCFIKVITWLWPKIPKQWIKDWLGIKSPSKVHTHTGHGSKDIAKQLYSIKDYPNPAISLENATKEELEAIKEYLIKHGYKVVDEPPTKPVSRDLPSEMFIKIHEPYEIATHGGEWIRYKRKKGGAA